MQKVVWRVEIRAGRQKRMCNECVSVAKGGRVASPLKRMRLTTSVALNTTWCRHRPYFQLRSMDAALSPAAARAAALRSASNARCCLAADALLLRPLMPESKSCGGPDGVLLSSSLLGLIIARGSFFRISSSTSSVSFFFFRFPSLSSDAAPSAADAHCRIAERCGERTSRRAPPGPSNASDTDKKNTTTHRSTGIIFPAFDAVRFASRCIVQLRCAMGRAVTCLATKTVPYRARNSVLVTSSFEPLNFH
jgi:hypothetical protein